MGHDDGAHDAHGLLQLRRAAVLAVGDEEPFQQLLLVRFYCDILGTNTQKKGGFSVRCIVQQLGLPI